MTLEVRKDQLMQELEALARFSDTPAPAVTRVVFSEVDLQARAWLKGLCAEAGLTVREDAVGNTFARWEGSSPELPAVASGSHIDAIPHSGRYDGTVGSARRPSKPSAPFRGPAIQGRAVRSSLCCSLPKNPRASALAVSAAA